MKQMTRSLPPVQCINLFLHWAPNLNLQNLYRIDNLPPAWRTTSWPTLLAPCHDIYHSVNPKGINNRETSNTFDYNTRMAQQRRFASGSYSLQNFAKKLKRNKESIKDSNVKSFSQNSSTVGQLCHVTEELYEDAVDDAEASNDIHDESNDTNETDLLYFSRMTNHYLCLVKSSTHVNIRHSMQYPVIADSGANFTRKENFLFI
jgi:hypothetical protein